MTQKDEDDLLHEICRNASMGVEAIHEVLKDIYDAVPGEGEKQLNTKIDQLYRSFDFVQVTDIVSDSINRLEKAFLGRAQTGHREVEAVKRYIAAHYGEEMSVERLSELVYMAPSYLSSVFKKETGQNLNRFIKSVRMEKASFWSRR